MIIYIDRVINDFMIQGGDPTGTGRGGTSIYGFVFILDCSLILISNHIPS